MAHEVRAKVDTNVVAHKDLEITIKTSTGGRLGKLLISKGNIEWLPKGNSVRKRRLTWTKFAQLFEEEGRLVRAKKKGTSG